MPNSMLLRQSERAGEEKYVCAVVVDRHLEEQN